jgi:putative hydrolases of HD superfamily
MQNNYNFEGFFKFLRNAEKLKTELRHSWTSDNNRQESVAEHTEMTSLVAVLLVDKVGVKLDQIKVLKMIIIHDLVEVFAGDIPAHEISERKINKFEIEKKAIKKIVSTLDENTASEIVDLWEEFEKVETPEAKFAYALDKFECLVEHNIADIDTWDEGDYRYTFVEKQDTPFNFDKFMRELKNHLDRWTYSKTERAGTTKRVPKENLELFHKNQDSSNS